MNYEKKQLVGLVILRVLIGWHLLYEGFVKLINPYWTGAEYLNKSQWIFSGIFRWIAETPDVLKVVDQLNIWLLIFIGIGLIAGIFIRTTCLAGIALLLLYYISNPPLIGTDVMIPLEGNYLFVNKILIEMAALYVLYAFPTGHYIGLDRFLLTNRKGILS
jgi:thiosulfate dehydrogenase [quinone] large subunit